MDEETVYTLEGKVFPRKFRKFGDICLTENNERIFICNICKCLNGTATQFWKHQKEEHSIRDYQDTIDNPDFEEKVDKTEAEQNIDGKQSTKKTRSSDKFQNGSAASPECKTLVDEHHRSFKKRKLSDTDDSKHTDSPLLKQALKEASRVATASHQIPRATQEQLYEALNSSCNEDNFNEFISFCCPECGKRFQTDAQWKQHTAAAHNFFAPDQLNISLHKVNPDGTTIYKCDICNVLLNKPNIAPLRRHKLTHMPFKSFCCRLCGTKIRHKSGIVHHMRTVHRKGTETRKPFKCGECLKSFATSLLYKKHFRINPNGGSPCGGLNVNSFAMLQDMDTTADDSISYHNEMSEDGNYDNSFGANLNESSDDEEYDPSAFLVTEMTEEGMPNNAETLGHPFDAKIKEEPPEEIIDTAEGYMDLWQEDAALVAEQQMQRRNESNQRMGIAAEHHTDFTAAPSSFDCAVCCRLFNSKLMLKRHLRKHGKNMDCRHCGVKISSIKALRRHLDLNRCKVLTGQVITLDDRRNHLTDSLLEVRDDYVEPLRSLPQPSNLFNCEVCNEPFETEYLLSLHGGRKHGKTDCRMCGVKISTLGALKRHYDWNRCKALK